MVDNRYTAALHIDWGGLFGAAVWVIVLAVSIHSLLFQETRQMTKTPMTEAEYDRQVNGAILDGGALDFNFNRRFLQSLTRRGLTLAPRVEGEPGPKSYSTQAPAARPTMPGQPRWSESWIVEAGTEIAPQPVAGSSEQTETTAAGPVEQTDTAEA